MHAEVQNVAGRFCGAARTCALVQAGQCLQSAKQQRRDRGAAAQRS